MHKLRNDLILIGSLVFIAVLGIILFFTLNTKENLLVQIYYDKEVIYEIDMNDEQKIEVNEVVIVITKTGVYVEDSTCEDKICVHQGIINISGQTITCLPNKVFIKLVGKGVDIGI